MEIKERLLEAKGRLVCACIQQSGSVIDTGVK